MKLKQDYRIGIGASSILLILVVLALAALSLLSLGSAKNNAALTERNLNMTLSYYQAAAKAQRTLAMMDSLVSDRSVQNLTAEEWTTLFSAHGLNGITVSDGMAFSFSIDAGAERILVVEGKFSPQGTPRLTLTRHELTSQTVLESKTLNVAMP